MENYVIGSKKSDNKDPKNRQLATSSSMMGKVPNQKADYYRPQNSAEQTSKPVFSDTKMRDGRNPGDKAVSLQAKRQKTIIRKNATYSDGAIGRAKAMRGM